MIEGIPNDKKLVDRAAPHNLDTMEISLWRGRYEEMEEKLETMKPSFEDFFTRIIKQQPDYIVLLDKGARPFGAPFERYLNGLNLKKKPKIIFWNDNEYKYHDSTTESVEQKFSREYGEMKNLHGKKLFIVDETIAHGNGARRIKKFIDSNNIDGQYFAFSYVDDGDDTGKDAFEAYFKNDNRFHLYRNVVEMTLFTKEVANFYVADFENDTIETKKRFEYVDPNSNYKSKKDIEDEENGTKSSFQASQEELEKMKKFAEETRRKTSDAIYKSLQEMSLGKEGELGEITQFEQAA